MKDEVDRSIWLTPRALDDFSHPRQEHVDLSWMDEGQCFTAGVHTSVFWPEQGEPSQPAKDVCDGGVPDFPEPCPVAAKCREWSLVVADDTGIFAGCDGQDRRALRRERRQIQKAAEEDWLPWAEDGETPQPCPRCGGAVQRQAERRRWVCVDCGWRPRQLQARAAPLDETGHP